MICDYVYPHKPPVYARNAHRRTQNDATILSQARVSIILCMLAMQAPVARGTGIWVDHFAAPGGVYVLTHFHSDHYRGLGEFWRHGLVHCSHITAKLLKRRGWCTSCVVPHNVDEPFRMLDPSTGLEHTAVLLDANHCPGAIMVIISGLPA